jgi:hypothetical protein
MVYGRIGCIRSSPGLMLLQGIRDSKLLFPTKTQKYVNFSLECLSASGRSRAQCLYSTGISAAWMKSQARAGATISRRWMGAMLAPATLLDGPAATAVAARRAVSAWRRRRSRRRRSRQSGTACSGEEQGGGGKMEQEHYGFNENTSICLTCIYIVHFGILVCVPRLCALGLESANAQRSARP